MPPLHHTRLRRDPLLGPEAPLNRARFAPTTLSPFERNPPSHARTYTHNIRVYMSQHYVVLTKQYKI